MVQLSAKLDERKYKRHNGKFKSREMKLKMGKRLFKQNSLLQTSTIKLTHFLIQRLVRSGQRSARMEKLKMRLISYQELTNIVNNVSSLNWLVSTHSATIG